MRGILSYIFENAYKEERRYDEYESNYHTQIIKEEKKEPLIVNITNNYYGEVHNTIILSEPFKII